MPPNAISSLWLPRSAMPEGVNTTISFALFMVKKPVCHYYAGAPLGKLEKLLLYLHFGLVIKSRGGLVQYQYAGILQKYAGYGYALLLAAGKLPPARPPGCRSPPQGS